MYTKTLVSNLISAVRIFQWKPIYACYVGKGKGKGTAAVWQLLLLLAQRKNVPTANQHGADGEDLFCICVSRDVPKPNTGEAAEREVQSGDIGTSDRRPAQGIVPIVGRFQSLPQLMEPACKGIKNEHLSLQNKVPVLAPGHNDE